VALVLKAAGHTVAEACDGAEGLKLASERPFDLVITDIVMPNVDGTEVIMSLSRQPDHPPILAISGGGNQVPAEIALLIARQVANASLAKPFESKELLATVDRLLAKAAA
jgi:DNA-binding response OmpR family regulator